MAGNEALTIEIVDNPSGVRILKLSGALTLQTMFEFQDLVRKERTKPLVIDISAVPYMDSAGLGCVIGAYTSCQTTNRGFGITGLTPRIRTLFQVTHVDGMLPCFDTLDAAEKAALAHV